MYIEILKLFNLDKKLGEKETLNLHSKKNPPKQEEEEEEEEDQALEKGKKEKKTLHLSGIPSLLKMGNPFKRDPSLLL